MVAALVASIVPLIKSYGRPREWRPRPIQLWRMARQNMPLAAADGVEWGSRRLDLAILGLFATPYIVGLYYVAPQVASLPQKMTTSYDPILGTVITPNPGIITYSSLAMQERQVGFWSFASQACCSLAIVIPVGAVMGMGR